MERRAVLNVNKFYQLEGVMSTFLTIMLVFTVVSSCLIWSVTASNIRYVAVTNEKFAGSYKTITDSSAVKCGLLCSHGDKCNAFNHQESTRTCELVACSNEDQSSTSSVSAGWKAYRRTCPEGWTAFEASCHYISTISTSWANAQNECAKYGAHLTDIKSESENDFIMTLYKSFWGADGSHTLWLGCNDRDAEGEYVWSDGTPTSAGFERWDYGQPDNRFGAEDCVNMIPSRSYRWNDDRCYRAYEFSCEN